MLGERSDQRGLWEADRLYLDHVGRETFYGLLASLRGRLFRDADFAEFYCADNGRDSVPPSLLATALLLQTHDKVSDAEAKARADFDIRWKVALGIEIEDRPFAKSTLQVFRAQLILHDRVREVFESSLRLARESGYLKKRSMKVALDTTNILGRGAVKDTFNLLADGIVKLLRALAAVEQTGVKEWAGAQGYGRYLASSIKGEAAIDWSDKRARQALLAGIVADPDRLLELARLAQGELPEDSIERQQIVTAAELLGELLLQDIERKSPDGDGDGDGGGNDGVSLKGGVSKDRMMSVHDPDATGLPRSGPPRMSYCGRPNSRYKMLPLEHPDRIHVAFDDHRLVSNAGLLLPAILALRLGLRELVDHHLDLGDAPGRANTGDKLMTLVASALAGGDCIDDADALRSGSTGRVLGCRSRRPPLSVPSCAASAGAMSASWTG